MSTWAELGLPVPEVSGYSYSTDAGLLRTSFPTAHPRQKRAYRKNRRLFTLEVQLTQAQLKTATDYLEAGGFTWFPITLLSGKDFADSVSVHCLRLTSDYSVSAVGYDLYKLQMSAEQLVENSVLVTSILYPLDVWEGAELELPDTDNIESDFSSDFYGFEEISLVAPDAGEFGLSLEIPNWNPQTAAPDDLGLSAPDASTFLMVFGGIIWNTYSQPPDSISLALPARITVRFV